MWKMLLVVGLIQLKFYCTYSQEISIDSATDWKLYNVTERVAYTIPIDTLVYIKNTKLNKEMMKGFLSGIKPLPDTVSYAWMGAYAVTCIVQKRIRKLLVSTYGGFIFDCTNKHYYQVKAAAVEKWVNYFNKERSDLNRKYVITIENTE